MADNNTILEKLEGLVARFEEVSTLITDPAVIADQKRYVKLTKEYKELGDLMNARKEYMQVLGGIEEAKEIIANETDQEIREMAREELDACQTRQPELEASFIRAIFTSRCVFSIIFPASATLIFGARCTPGFTTNS